MAKLFIVGVPIGNLKDITLRALETLKEIDIIACENIEIIKKLLNHYQIFNKKLLIYNNYNEKNSAKGIIKIINEQNENVILVSAAGMPVVSDPGFEVIRQSITNNIEIEIIPGVSACISAFVLSNLSDTFSFLGFLKSKTIQKQNQLKKLSKGTYVIYESPHRIKKTLEDIRVVFGDQISIFVVKEMTKKFETHFRGSVLEIIQQLENKIIKGEFTLVLNIL